MKKIVNFIIILMLICGVALSEEIPEFQLNDEGEVEERYFVLVDDFATYNEFDESKITLGVGETYTPTLYTDAPFWSIKFYSKNKKVATVEEDGTIYARKKGSTKIIADTIFAPTAYVKVEVKNKPAKITIPSSINIHVGETLPIKVKLSSGAASHIQWETSNKKIVTAADNLAYGQHPGTAYLMATTYNGKSAICKVNVYKWPTNIYIDKYISLKKGKTKTITPEFKKNEWDTYKVYSSNKKIVSVSNNNKIKGKKRGYAAIRIYTSNGAWIESTVHVY